MNPNDLLGLVGPLIDTGSAALKGAVELGGAGVELATSILDLIFAAIP